MRIRIPQITIRTGNSRLVMKRISELVTTKLSASLEIVDRLSEAPSELIIRPKRPSRHRGLLVRLVSRDVSSDVIDVEPRASHWSPDGPATREAYVAAGRDLLSSILEEYGKRYKPRLRMYVARSELREPRLPRGAERLFRHFVERANKTTLHELDWRRFYDFIGHCAAYDVRIDEQQVEELLSKAGFAEKYAKEIAVIWWHGRNMKWRWG
jgi:hypothetical protein